MARVGNLEVADRDAGCAQPRRDTVEPVVGLRYVEDQVTREEQIDVAHESLGEADGTVCGPPRVLPL
jgi:hypothetical protein